MKTDNASFKNKIDLHIIVVDLQCCVSFMYTAVLFKHTHTHTHVYLKKNI